MEDDLELFKATIKKGIQKFNKYFEDEYQILFDESKENLTIEEIKKIITGCIIFVKI